VSTGCSQPQKLAQNWPRPTPIQAPLTLRSKSHNLCADVLAGMENATIVPDAVHAKMFRALYPDGQLSDIMNTTRAEQAMFVFEEHGTRRTPARSPVAGC